MTDISNERDPYLLYESYASLTDKQFKILPPEGEPIACELVEVSERKVRGPFESFAIVLVTEPIEGAESGMFKVQHSELGEFHLNLSPIKRTDTGEFELEAVFTLPVSK